MLSQNELKLLESPGIGKFPLLAAAKGMIKRCSKCSHSNVNAGNAFKLAIGKYRRDPEFIALCKSLFPLPVILGGVLVP